MLLTIEPFDVILEWDPLTKLSFDTKMSNHQLNAIAYGPLGSINGNFVYTDKSNKRIKLGDVLGPGKHKITMKFIPNNTNNYKSAKIITKIFIVKKEPNYIKIKFSSEKYTHIKYN